MSYAVEDDTWAFDWRDLAQRPATELFRRERDHQNERGFNADHDDAHTDGEIAQAALVYLECAMGQRDPSERFVFADESLTCKPRGERDPIHDLIKAGALIAAETDRLLRAARREAIDHVAHLEALVDQTFSTSPEETARHRDALIHALRVLGVAESQAVDALGFVVPDVTSRMSRSEELLSDDPD